MKIGIDLGHCLNGYDTSAAGIIKESDANRKIGACLIPKLKALGHTVVNCTIDSGCSSINDSLRKRVNIANSNNVDVFISIHLNAFNGSAHGAECWISGTGGKAQYYANKIQAQLVSLGYYNRGVKVGNLYVTKNTVAPAVLLECFFIDNKSDISLFNADKIANAICVGLTGQGSNATEDTNKPSTSNPNPSNSTGEGVYEWEDMPSPNAIIINDWFYVRDKYGNQVNGRHVDMNDKVFIIDIGYSKQLVELFYPTPIQPIHAYIKNATNCIQYMYQDQYHNGSTSESVYETSACTNKIGSLNPYETATPLYRKDGVLHIVYSTSKGRNTKSGFVKYNGGFSKF